MNIVVCVKYVPDATADRQFESDNTVDRVGVDGLLSELDEYAVEQALQIKEKADADDTQVTALCVGPGEGRRRGPQGPADGCRQGRPRGRRRDRRLRRRRHLAGARQGGREARRREAGRPRRVRHGLDRRRDERRARRCSPSASASRRSPSPRSSRPRATRSGSSATATPPPRSSARTMPLVLSVTDQTGEARYPSFKGIMAAKKKPHGDLLAGRPRRRGRPGRPLRRLDRGRGDHRRVRRAPPARSSPTRTARAPRR